jgi:ATP synthase F1 gamma subunit
MHGRIEGVNEPHSLVVRNLKKCAKMRLIVAGTLNLALHFPEMRIHRFVQLKMSIQCRTKSDFIFEPSEEVLVTELMPKILNTQVFKAVLDAHASEHGARMTAMDKASENANELLRGLKISYNRARQAAITTELTEIVSGAAALQGA